MNALSDILGHLSPAAAYAAVAAAVLAESVLLLGAFVPTLTLLLTAGVLARTGQINLLLVVAVAAAPWWWATSSPTAPAGTSVTDCAAAPWAVAFRTPPGAVPRR